MAEDIAISVNDVSKMYKLYDNPMDRLKESLGLSRKKKYKEHYALNHVSFQVHRGETVGIIGTNGSGKSTILKIITGVLSPTAGEVAVNGRISALLELGAGFNGEYSGLENVYLNGSMIGFSREEIDELENYVIRTGARGYRTYSRLFTRRTEELQGNVEGSEQAEEKTMERLNRIRQQFMDAVEILHMGSQEKAGDYVSHLYDFLEQNQVQQKLLNYQQQFEKEGDLSRAREYAQIYRLVMDLLDQVYELLGEEEISRQEFADILEAGFGEITVGTIPQNVDRIVVGDMERTRLKQVKVLFFLGVNDGNIPKNASKGGIISDMDREFLIESGTEMAPSPRQQMYIQRLYLYLNMTKPSEQLYLSYAKVNSEGKGIRPSYLIDTVRKLFPAMGVEYPQNRSRLEQIEGRQEGARYLAEELREYVEKNKQYVTEFLQEKIPLIHPVAGDATYLMWLDCRKITESGRQFVKFIRKTSGLYVSGGNQYGRGGEGFLRVNVATSKLVVEDGMQRLYESVDAWLKEEKISK